MYFPFKNVRLLSWATDLPDDRLTSAALEEQLWPLLKALDLPRGTLATKTGILERRVAAADQDPEPVAARVAKAALERGGARASDVGAVYSASIDHRYFEPSSAHFVGDALGVSAEAQLLDVRNACLGFLDALSMAAAHIEAGHIEVAVVVAAEAGGMRRIIDGAVTTALARGRLEPCDWVPLTMGCGAVAWVLCSSRYDPGFASLDAFMTRSHVSHLKACSGRIEDDGRLTVDANGAAILRHGVPLMADTLARGLRSSKRDVGVLFTHQVSAAFSEALSRKSGTSIDPRTQVYAHLGNTGPVGLPLAFAHAADAGWLAPGASLSLIGGSSGLSSSWLGATWLGRPS